VTDTTAADTDLRKVEHCIADSPAHHWLERHGYREVARRNVGDGSGVVWLKMERGAERDLMADIFSVVRDATRALYPGVTVPDPRDPDPSRDGVFQTHNCSRCQHGKRACVRGDPRRCENLHARND
jgi:hypothetical protein